MASDGRIREEPTEFPLDRAVDLYNKLRAGPIVGRAVLTP